MTHKLMIDSGAYTAWTAGIEIDVFDYAKWCLKEGAGASFYVNLDVIPRKGARLVNLHDACEQSWDNYERLIHLLHPPKVIPVFHIQDPIEYLDKYVQRGETDYIALGGLAKTSKRDRFDFLKEVEPALKYECIRMHGLAITSWDILTRHNWYSVDSSSWKHIANWGGIYVPRTTNGEFDYKQAPLMMGVSPMSTTRFLHQSHMDSSTPMVKEHVHRYLDEVNLALGESIFFDTPLGYKLAKHPIQELWFKKGKRILQPIIKGVSNSFEERCKANIYFMRKAAKALGIRIYLAGNPLPYEAEYQMGRRLLSYHYILLYKNHGARCLARHLQDLQTHRHTKE